jgi:hypothetical protein
MKMIVIASLCLVVLFPARGISLEANVPHFLDPLPS